MNSGKKESKRLKLSLSTVKTCVYVWKSVACMIKWSVSVYWLEEAPNIQTTGRGNVAIKPRGIHMM